VTASEVMRRPAEESFGRAVTTAVRGGSGRLLAGLGVSEGQLAEAGDIAELGADLLCCGL
jgi:hypothetical protein